MAPASAHPDPPPRQRSGDAKAEDLHLYGDIDLAKTSYKKDSQIPTLAAMKAHIPAHCFRSSLPRSIYYVIRDFVFISALYYGAYLTHGTQLHYAYLPFFWFFTGFFMWAVFVLGHDCGHGSFSKYKSVNSFFGHILHSMILVPFHSWRISHRKHHKNTGNYEKDEIFYPIPEWEYAGIQMFPRAVYKYLNFLGVFGYAIYLVKGYGNAMKNGSHFSPYSELFTKDERPMIITSVSCWSAMASLLAACAYRFGMVNVITYYFVPLSIYCTWLLVVTFLHHTEPGTKWYNTKNWSYVRGNLESIDRVYGLFEHFHHYIGYHVVHHAFPAIPHYHLKEATEAIKPFLGELHKVEKQNPLLQLPESLSSWKACHVIPDSTDMFVLPKAK